MRAVRPLRSNSGFLETGCRPHIVLKTAQHFTSVTTERREREPALAVARLSEILEDSCMQQAERSTKTQTYDRYGTNSVLKEGLSCLPQDCESGSGILASFGGEVGKVSESGPNTNMWTVVATLMPTVIMGQYSTGRVFFSVKLEFLIQYEQALARSLHTFLACVRPTPSAILDSSKS